VGLGGAQHLGRERVVARVLLGRQVGELGRAQRVLGELEHRLLAAGRLAHVVEVGGEGAADGVAGAGRVDEQPGERGIPLPLDDELDDVAQQLVAGGHRVVEAAERHLRLGDDGARGGRVDAVAVDDDEGCPGERGAALGCRHACHALSSRRRIPQSWSSVPDARPGRQTPRWGAPGALRVASRR